MAENRRSISLINSSETGSSRDFDQTVKSMEEQLRIQSEIASVERERQLALEKTREQQKLVGREAEISLKSTQKALSEVNSSTQKFVGSAGSSFKSLFSSLFKGEISSAEDFFSAFCNFLINAWSKAISKMATRGFEDLLGNLFGGFGGGAGGSSGASEGYFQWSETPDWFLNFHSGGIVGLDGTRRAASPLLMAGAPRLHSGLASDEFPAILQKGEVVIPRGGWSHGDTKSGQSAQAMNVEVKIDNQSSMPLKLEQGSITHSFDKMIIGVVAKDINEYGVLGQMLRNRK